MLSEHGRAGYVAVCEECEETSSPIEATREVAVLRLMRARWRVRTDEGVTRTWCAACQTVPSVPNLRLVPPEPDDGPPTERIARPRLPT